jgi:hypothetical protein
LGLAIHFGGKEFANAIKGYLVLGVLALVVLVIIIFLNSK